MPSSHLIPRLDTPLDREIDLDHLENTRRQIVGHGNLAPFFLETGIEVFPVSGKLLDHCFQLHIQTLVLDANVQPVHPVNCSQVLAANHRALIDAGQCLYGL